MAHAFEFGLDTFGDITLDANGRRKSQAQVLRDVVDEAVLADQVGVDASASASTTARTSRSRRPRWCSPPSPAGPTRIMLGSAVTVLSTDDPVRVFQRFSTLNAVSNGRAEVILGRGSFTESYPLFGYDLSALRRAVRGEARAVRRAAEGRPGHVDRTTRAPLTEQRSCTRRSRRARLRTWVGVGGSPESVVRAARYGLPLTLAIIGGSPQRFRPFVDLYRQALEQFGQPTLPVAVHSPGHVAATDDAGEGASCGRTTRR